MPDPEESEECKSSVHSETQSEVQIEMPIEMAFIDDESSHRSESSERAASLTSALTEAVAVTHTGGALEGDINPYAVHQKEDDEDASVGEEALEELHERAVFNVPDEHGSPAHYPGEEENQPHRGRELNEEEIKQAPHSVIGSGIESLKYLYSTALLIFSVILVMAAIFSEQTSGTADMGIPPVVAFFLFWFLICWLAMMEG